MSRSRQRKKVDPFRAELGKRLRAAREHLQRTRSPRDYTLRALAARLGISYQRLQQYESGIHFPEQPALLRALCDVLEITEAQLFRGDTVTPRDEERKDALAPFGPVKQVPIIEWENAPRFVQATEVERATMGAAQAPLLVPTTSKRCFALKVSDMTMEPIFPPGSLIVVDTERTAHPGDFVVAKVSANAQPTFKQLIIDAGKKFLRPINPQFPAVALTETGEIIGVVIQLVRNF